LVSRRCKTWRTKHEGGFVLMGRKRGGEGAGESWAGGRKNIPIIGPSAGSRSIASPPFARAAATIACVMGCQVIVKVPLVRALMVLVSARKMSPASLMAVGVDLRERATQSFLWGREGLVGWVLLGVVLGCGFGEKSEGGRGRRKGEGLIAFT